MMLTLIPRASSRQPMEAAARPLPSEDTTPPVTKMYFADMSATSLNVMEFCAVWALLSMAGMGGGGNGRVFCGNLSLNGGSMGVPRESNVSQANLWRNIVMSQDLEAVKHGPADSGVTDI